MSQKYFLLLPLTFLAFACSHGSRGTSSDEAATTEETPAEETSSANTVDIGGVEFTLGSDGVCAGKVINPCFPHSGKPFRKYQCMEFTDGQVHAYKESGSKKSYSNYSGLDDFFAKSGIAKSCAGMEPVVASAPSAPSTQNPQQQQQQQSFNSRGPLPIEGNDPLHYYASLSSEVVALADPANTLVNAPADETVEDVLELPTVPQQAPAAAVTLPETTVDFADSLKGRLFQLMTMKHIQKEGQADVLVEECPEELEEGAVCVGQTSYSYSDAREFMFGQIHLSQREDGVYQVEDTYCKRQVSKDDYPEGFERVPGVMRIPDHLVINCEHTWPKSRFSEKHSRNVQLTDLHHLYPTDTKVNRIRSNYQFALVDPATARGEQHEACNYHLLGNAVPVEGLPDPGNTDYFQPPEYHRGNVARALFYFSTRYQIAIEPLEEHYLRLWHKEDPVDEAEISRNQQIYQLQGIRNPFIDFPALVHQIDDF